MKHIKAKEPMGKAAVLNKLLWAAGAAGALMVCFILCRHIFYELHVNRQWPLAMLLLGLVVILIAAVPGAKKMMVCTVAGYLTGFIAGIAFNVEYDVIIDSIVVEQRYTAWHIWTVVFITIIIAGAIWDVLSRNKTKKTDAVHSA